MSVCEVHLFCIYSYVLSVKRQVITLKRLQMTDLKITLKRGASSKEVKEALSAEDVVSQWQTSTWGRKRAGFQAKRELTDFQRFKLQRAKCILSKSA